MRFEFCGLASLDDLTGEKGEQCEQTVAELEMVQAQFLAANPHPAGYRWPRDPLHTWSRVWEYPYVFGQIKRYRDSVLGRETKPKAVDFGSGITFFPFAVARLGFEVVCLDCDPVCEAGISKASQPVDASPGTVSFRLVGEERTALPLECGAVDVLYTISVLEGWACYRRA